MFELSSNDFIPTIIPQQYVYKVKLFYKFVHAQFVTTVLTVQCLTLQLLYERVCMKITK